MKLEKYTIQIYVRNNKKPIVTFDTYDENDIDEFFKQMNDSSFRFLQFGPIGLNKVEFSHCIIKSKKK